MTDDAVPGGTAPQKAPWFADESGAERAARSAVWEGTPQRLDRVLTETGLARSRSQAAELISAGCVLIGGAAATKAGAKVLRGSRIEATGTDHYVSRAAHKLIAGLDAFDVNPAGRLALDLGASTGGFTQVLFERGARAVQAIDVGHGQIVPALRADPRVRLVEGCNARELTAESLAEATGLGERPELVVADLSFISLTLILPAIARTAAPHAELILLIKPQFEVGREGVREGVVTDPELHASAIRAVLSAAAEQDYATVGLVPSPITGGSGNREFLVHLTRGARADQTEWEERIRELSADVAGAHRAADDSSDVS